MKIETFRKPTVGMRAVLQEGALAQSLGTWMDVSGFERFSLHVAIAGTATVQVYLSNEPVPAADGGVKLGSDISSSSVVQLTVPVRWIRVKISAWSSGAVSAFLEAKA